MKCAATLIFALLFYTSAVAAPESISSQLHKATELVDRYYGSAAELNEAAILTSTILATNDPPSDAYVQAARIVLKGGHIVSDVYEPNTMLVATHFIDLALKVSPDNVRALSLRGSILLVGHDLPAAYKALQRAFELDPSYPWTYLHLGTYYEAIGDYRSAVKQYGIVVSHGCSNTDLDQRRAFTDALTYQAFLMHVSGQESLLRQYAKSADDCRDPKDAWTLGNFAGLFNQIAFFEDAAVYARKALGVMRYGVAQKEFAMALYGQAARVKIAGGNPSNLLSEASSLRFEPGDVTDWFYQSKAEAHAFAAPVSELIGIRPR